MDSDAATRQDSTAEAMSGTGSIIMNATAREISLDNLLSSITTENLHCEVDFGKAEGKELC